MKTQTVQEIENHPHYTDDFKFFMLRRSGKGDGREIAKSEQMKNEIILKPIIKKPAHQQRVVVGATCGAELCARYDKASGSFYCLATAKKLEGDFVVWAALPNLEKEIKRHRSSFFRRLPDALECVEAKEKI